MRRRTTQTVRVRRHPDWHPVTLPDGRTVAPGEVTDAVPVEEARLRPDFLVEVVPETDEEVSCQS